MVRMSVHMEIALRPACKRRRQMPAPHSDVMTERHGVLMSAKPQTNTRMLPPSFDSIPGCTYKETQHSQQPLPCKTQLPPAQIPSSILQHWPH